MALLAAPAAAQPRVEQRAFEEIAPGVFVRGGAVSIDVDPRCDGGCPAGKRCQQVCEDHACTAEAPSDALCSACTWQCVRGEPDAVSDRGATPSPATAARRAAGRAGDSSVPAR